METQRHIVAEAVVLHLTHQPLRIGLRPVLHILAGMVQVTCAIEVITRIVRTAIRAGGVVAGRTLVGEALVVADDMLLGQLIRSVRTEVILEEITPGIVVPTVVQYHVCQHFRIALMQRRDQLLELGFRPPIALLVAVLTSRVAYAITRRTGAGREPYHVEVGIDSRRILHEVDPLGTTELGVGGRLRLVAVPVEGLKHHVFTLCGHTCILCAQRTRARDK